jgi:hypothetical protein
MLPSAVIESSPATRNRIACGMAQSLTGDCYPLFRCSQLLRSIETKPPAASLVSRSRMPTGSPRQVGCTSLIGTQLGYTVAAHRSNFSSIYNGPATRFQILPLRPLNPIFLPYFAPEPCFGGVGARLLSPASPVLALVQGG